MLFKIKIDCDNYQYDNIKVVRITALNWRFNNRKYDHNIITILSSSGTKVTCSDSGDLKKETTLEESNRFNFNLVDLVVSCIVYKIMKIS